MCPVPLYHYIIVPLYHRASVPLYHYTIVTFIIVSLLLIMVGMFLYESNSEDDERSCGESKNKIHAQANVDRDREMVRTL